MAKIGEIIIDEDKECVSCHKPGATQNGLCMECVLKRLEHKIREENKVGTEYLKCVLTNDQVREYGIELARKNSENESLDAQKKSFDAQIGASIKKVLLDIVGLSQKIQNGYEFLQVEVEERRDYDDKIIETVRLDTGEVIRTRDMTQDDLQDKLFPSEEEAQE